MKTRTLIGIAGAALWAGTSAAFEIAVPPDAAPSVEYAATELRDYVGRLNGKAPTVVTNAAPEKGVAIAIDPKSDDDSFEFRSSGDLLRILGGKRGVIYGVCELLERFGGVEWLSSWHTYVPKDRKFRVPRDLNERHAPAFALRENIYGDPMEHFEFAVHQRLNGLKSHDSLKPHPVDPKFGGKGWRFVNGLKNCHTLKFLVPVEKYYKDHPEYYALVDGIRRDIGWQLCYTNPDVLRICTERVLELLAADPTAKFVGVSHNDNRNNYCRCERCAAVDAEEESHAGTELRFVNAIADEVKKRYPHVYVQTLAYQYTRKPPKLTKPRDNVVITLCSIECDRLRPFGAANGTDANREFEEDLRGWAKLTDKLYVWDYTGENLHYLYPMPNAANIQANIRYFRDNNVKFLFSEGNGRKAYHTEFGELKSWLVSKAMWNPDEPLEGLLGRFFNGFYGAAAPFVREYYEMESRLVDAAPPGTKVTIYQTDNRKLYTDAFVDRALELWDKAEAAVRDDPAALYNVRNGKASVVRLKLDRLTDGVKWVWVTRHPEKFPKTDPRAAGYEKYMLDVERESEARGHAVLFGNTPQRDLRPRQQWRRAVTMTPPEKGCDSVHVDVDAMGITELKFAKIVKDDYAIGGRAVEINNRYEEPGPYLDFSNVAYDPGVKYRVWIRAKVTPLANGYGEAVRLRAGDQEIVKDVKELEPGYVWYSFEPFVPKGSHQIHVRPGHRTAKGGGGRMAIESIRVDRFVIERAGAGPENVPELMRTSSGRPVTTRETWEKVRRPEIRELFLHEIYGRRPAERPARLKFAAAEPDKVMLDGKAVRKRIRISYGDRCGDSSFVLTAFIPTAATAARPAPAFLLICNCDPKVRTDVERVRKDDYWPVERLVERGYAALTFWNGDLAADRAGEYASGVFSVFGKPSERTDESWGVLSAWAWGASRAMDWIGTERLLDAKHVGVVGHSRGGKTALLAGVCDERFAMACVNDSGCGGAKLNHIQLPLSEHYDQIWKNYGYWFCGNFRKYLGREREAPFDAHWWAALMAPRLLAIASASGDYWAGQTGEFLTAKYASPAWELYGRKGLVGAEPPGVEVPLQEGCVSYHMRKGPHELALYDWERYMDFADRHGWRGKESGK